MVSKRQPREALDGARELQRQARYCLLGPETRVWTYARDERALAGARPSAAAHIASPDGKGNLLLANLAYFSGVLVAAGFNGLYGTGRSGEAACSAHVRRKFFDVQAATKSAVVAGALQRIGALYDVERDIRGRLLDERRRQKQAHSRPITAVEQLHYASWTVLST